jgi:hypothetical protein
MRFRAKTLLCAVAILGSILGSPISAQPFDEVGDKPAATLLLPYFEMEYDNPNGLTTLFAIGNAAPSAQLAHVTVWTDRSIPVLDFDVYLTGWDIQTFNLRDILEGGILPQTGSGTSPLFNDPASPLGPYSFPDVIYPNCNTTSNPPVPPVYEIPAISPNFKIHLRALLTGQQSPINGNCSGNNYGDDVARGYITVDDVNACSTFFPADVGYFISGGLGIADNDNVLWGDYYYVHPGNNFAQGETLVHIEADAVTFSTPGDYTFYGRYVAGTASDNRKPLATTWATRYIEGAAFSGGTDLIVWRDSKFPPGSSCVTGPNYGDLFEQQIVLFDELENPFVTQTGGPSGEPTPGAECVFCDEAQRVAVSSLSPVSPFGWIFLNLNHFTALDAGLGPGYIGVAQSWVTSVISAEGRFSVGFDAIQLDNASAAVPGGPIIGPPV